MPKLSNKVEVEIEGKKVLLYEPQSNPRCNQVAYHASTTPNLLALGTRGTGKALSLDTPIPTPKGWVTMADLAVGDYVLASDGIPTRVTWKSQAHVDPTGTFRLTFDDDSQIVCGGHHEWFTRNLTERYKQGSLKTTEQIAASVKSTSGRETNHRVDLGRSWQLPSVDLPLDPYVLGVWLGDGHKTNGNITSADPEILDRIRAKGWDVRKLKSAYGWSIRGLMGALRSLDATTQLRTSHGACAGCQHYRCLAGRHLCYRCYDNPTIRLQHPKRIKPFHRYTGGVLGNKRIPAIYLRASIEQRLELLCGLMDTDGSCDTRQHTCEFTNMNRLLAEGVFELAISLGLKPHWGEGRATLNGRDCGPKYRVTWTATLPVFTLPRKLVKLPIRVRPTQTVRYIVRVERITDQLLQCIEVEHPSHLYLCGKTAIPTHNSMQGRWDAIIRCLMFPQFRALIIRRKITDLRKSHLHHIGHEMRQLGQPDFVQTFNLAKFHNGSIIQFSHCENLKDVENYLSSEWDYIFFDELSSFPLEMFLMISGAARSNASKPYRALVRAGSNTLGIGSQWMKAWFVDKVVDPAEYPDYDPAEYEVQYSWLDGNKFVEEGYVKRLRNMPAHVRRSWLDLEFVVEGAYFSDFTKSKVVDRDTPEERVVPWHVITTLPVWKQENLFDLQWLSIYRCIDWGYFPDPAVCLWIATLPNKHEIVFKERTWKQTLAVDVAKQIKAESHGLHVVETFCDPSMFAKTGQAPYSVGEQFEQAGVPLTASTNSRELCGYAIHEHLNTIIDDHPQMQIVAPLGKYGCPDLLRTLPMLQMDKNDTRKIAAGEDHWAIALSYYCMGQAMPSQDPVRASTPFWMRPKRTQREIIANATVIT